MKAILFVTPPLYAMNGPELSLLSIASYIERETDFSFRIVDMNIENLRNSGQMLSKKSPRMSYEELREVIVKEHPRIVAVSALTSYISQSLRVLELAKEIDSSIKTVIGGHHASAVMSELMERYSYVDILVYGEGEDTFLELARDILESPESCYAIAGTIIRRGQDIQVNPPRALRKNLDFYPFLNRGLIPIQCYPKPYRIISSRGCPFNCIFCLRKVFGRSWRGRSADNVVDEIELLHKRYGWERFTFSDDNFTLNKERVKDIARKILERNLAIKWDTGTGVRADCIDYETLKLMKESGCTTVGIGIESGCQHILENINKKETLDDFLKIIKIAYSAGLKIHGSFMVGNPGDNISTIKMSIEFAKQCVDNGLRSVSWNMAKPYPGTVLWEYVMNNGKLLNTYYNSRMHYTNQPLFETADFDVTSRKEAIRLAERETKRYVRRAKIKSLLRNPKRILPFIIEHYKYTLSLR